MSDPSGYKGNKHFSQLITKVRVISYNGKFVVQARLPFHRGFFKMWYGVDSNEELRGSGLSQVDRWDTPEQAESFAKKLSENLAKTKHSMEMRTKNGVIKKFNIKTIKDDPEFFI